MANDVKFVRIRGRIVPIKRKKDDSFSKSPVKKGIEKGAKIGAAVGAIYGASQVAVATFVSRQIMNPSISGLGAKDAKVMKRIVTGVGALSVPLQAGLKAVKLGIYGGVAGLGAGLAYKGIKKSLRQSDGNEND